MSVEFTAEEAYVLAEQVEKKAEQFYLSAAERSTSESLYKLYMKLARMERDHAHVFDAMKSAAGAVDPKPEALLQRLWPVLADSMVYDIDSVMPTFFTDARTSEAVLRAAMGFERDTILFFQGLRQMLAAPNDKQRIDDLLREEMGHLISLGSELALL